MHTSKKDTPSVQELIKAHHAIEDFLLMDEVNSVQDTLSDLLLTWMRAEEELGHTYRCRIVAHYEIMQQLLTKLAAMQEERRAVA